MRTLSPYRVLGLADTATPDEAKAAYRRLAKMLHPDTNESEVATEMMRLVNLAYEAVAGQVPPDNRTDDTLVPAWRYSGDPCAFRIPFGKHRGTPMGQLLNWYLDGRNNYFDWLAHQPDLHPALAAIMAGTLDHQADKPPCPSWRPV